MKLPEDRTTLNQIRAFAREQLPEGEELEMTKGQYLRYKEAVWLEDAISFVDGHRIKISTPEDSTNGNGSV